MKKKIFYLLLIVFAIIQFKRIDKTNPPAVASEDFFALNTAPDEVENLVRTACYDCHSHETTYPWYSNIAPVSWWLEDHYNEGREHLNFSTWAIYDTQTTDHKLEECVEMVEKKEMPMLPYMIAHQDAWLSEADRKLLVNYFSGLR